MSAFVDTSAFIALLVAEDQNHQVAASVWRQLVEGDDVLFTSNYVVVETCALLQKRAGMSAVRSFLEDVVPAVKVEWVDPELHASAMSALMFSSRNGPNVVDCVSFATMRKLGVRTAFAFDDHFSSQGFQPVA